VVHLPLGPASYDILLGSGLLEDLPELLRTRCPAAAYAVITDSTVAHLLGERVVANLRKQRPAFLATFAAGEWNKTRDTWGALTDQLLAHGLSRDGAVVALGGGVVGDLAGFVAATYLRGVPYVQVPTTLLAMIDSSIGGKTGVDTAHGKNLVGAFHQPRAVVADVDTLASLPPLHVSAGLAEALKHGAIQDAGYFAWLAAQAAALRAKGAEPLLHAVRRSIEIKAAIVAEDEREHGGRARLNFGHTVGHALEAVSGFELLHGEAVAIGMAVEAALGEQLGLTTPGTAAQLSETLARFGLPTEMPAGLSPERIISATKHDKKAREETVRFAPIAEIGRSAGSSTEGWTFTLPEQALRATLSAVSTP
jgi:3-dehydroquinate synthase